jgi:hypothetical protein
LVLTVIVGLAEEWRKRQVVLGKNPCEWTFDIWDSYGCRALDRGNEYQHHAQCALQCESVFTPSAL